MLVRLIFILSALLLSAIAEAATVRFTPRVKVNYECSVVQPRRCKTEDLMFATVVTEVQNGYGSWNFTADYGNAGYWLSVAIYEDDPGIFTIMVQGNVIDNAASSRLIWAYYRTELKIGESFATISGMTMPMVIQNLQYDMAFNIANFSVEP